jgi:hypothetical protein
MAQYNIALLLENDTRIDLNEKENIWQLLLEVNDSPLTLSQANTHTHKEICF